MLTSKRAVWNISLITSVMLLSSSLGVAAVNDPVITSAVVNSRANTLLITGTNLLGPNGSTIPAVHFASMVLAVVNASPTSITAGFPSGSPAGGVYTLTLVYSQGLTINFDVTVGGSVAPTASPVGVVMTLDSISCQTAAGRNLFPVTAWSLGTGTPSGSGGAGGSGPQLTNLMINKNFDDCSPDLFGNLLRGEHFDKAVLTQYAADQTPLVIVTLMHGFVAGYNLTGGGSNSTPTETVSFSYRQIDIKDAVTGSHFCWDLALNLPCSGT